ncbi:MAG TPA: phage integrase N-terminal SAM-like domain-containing protein, partial [Candidatus Deferrimicrobiaceae bacterium]
MNVTCSVQGTTRNTEILPRVRDELRRRHYSNRTEEAYIGWIRRFVQFHRYRHPLDMGEAEVKSFLSNLATHRKVAASTQNQALAALLFLYVDVLGVKLEWL